MKSMSGGARRAFTSTEAQGARTAQLTQRQNPAPYWIAASWAPLTHLLIHSLTPSLFFQVTQLLLQSRRQRLRAELAPVQDQHHPRGRAHEEPAVQQPCQRRHRKIVCA